MNKVKALFATPKKTILTCVCLVAILAILGIGTAFAASTITESSSIGSENAQNFAFADAGVDPTSAEDVTAEFTFEQGQFVYEVEFTAGGTSYQYWIKASDGTIVKKEMEIVSQDGAAETVAAEIGLDEAKAIALADAGLTEDDVTYTEARLDTDDGTSMYDIEFYTENIEYEYMINAATGAIYSRSKETTLAAETTTEADAETMDAADADTAVSSDTASTDAAADSSTSSDTSTSDGSTSGTSTSDGSTSSQIALETAKNTALSDAGVSASSVTYTKAKLHHEHSSSSVYDIEFYTSTYAYEYEISATTGVILEKSMEILDSAYTGGSGSYIGLDSAKSIAAAQAGADVSQVTFQEAELDSDDGHAVYELKFYANGYQCECEINAYTGQILEFEYEAHS